MDSGIGLRKEAAFVLPAASLLDFRRYSADSTDLTSGISCFSNLSMPFFSVI